MLSVFVSCQLTGDGCVLLQFEDSGNYLTSSEGHLPTLTMTFYDPKDEAMQYKFFVRHELSLRSLRVLGIFEDPSIAGDEPTDEDDDAVRTRLTEHLSAGHHLQPIQAQVLTLAFLIYNTTGP